MFVVRSLARPFLASLLAAAIAVSGAAACIDEWQSEQGEMACCKAMREDCAKHRTAAVNCCKTDRGGPQKATIVAANAPGKTPTQHLVSTSPVESIAFAVPALCIAPRPNSVDRYRPHAPPYLRHSALLI